MRKNRKDNRVERTPGEKEREGKIRHRKREEDKRGRGSTRERERLLKLEQGCVSLLLSLCTFAQAVSLKEVIEEWLQSIASRHDLL